MINKQNFIKYVMLTIFTVLMAGVTYAGEGDEEKKKGDSSKGEKSINKDSIDTDIKIEIADTDDTLVFEDWEKPMDNGFNEDNDEMSDNGRIAGGGDGTGTGMNRASAIVSADLVAMANPFKSKEYKVEFSVYPNPTVNELHIKPSITPSGIRIADISGKEHRATSFSPQIDVRDLPSGIYYIQLIYADHIEARKFIKS